MLTYTVQTFQLDQTFRIHAGLPPTEINDSRPACHCCWKDEGYKPSWRSLDVQNLSKETMAKKPMACREL